MTSDSVIGIDRIINVEPYFLTALIYKHFNFVLEHFGHAGGKYRQDKLIPTLKENNISPESVKSHNSRKGQETTKSKCPKIQIS